MSQGTPNPKSDQNPENFETEIEQQVLEDVATSEGHSPEAQHVIDELKKKSHFEGE